MIFDREITIYSNRQDNVGRVATFGEFLSEGIKHREEIEEARKNGTTKALKESLPCAAISGVFTPTRSKANLVKHSGLICVDIDHVNVSDVMAKLMQMDCVAYASASVSGQGVFAVIPIRYPSKHAEHYAALCRDLLAIGIAVDAQCKDVCRLRFASYDCSAMYRPDAVEYAGIYVEPKAALPTLRRRAYDDADQVLANVATCVQRIERFHVDITSAYDDWCAVGFSLASLGEDGREFFHVVSAQCPKYKRDEADRKFTEFLKSVSRIGIGTFFAKCQEYNITYK